MEVVHRNHRAESGNRGVSRVSTSLVRSESSVPSSGHQEVHPSTRLRGDATGVTLATAADPKGKQRSRGQEASDAGEGPSRMAQRTSGDRRSSSSTNSGFIPASYTPTRASTEATSLSSNEPSAHEVSEGPLGASSRRNRRESRTQPSEYRRLKKIAVLGGRCNRATKELEHTLDIQHTSLTRYHAGKTDRNSLEYRRAKAAYRNALIPYTRSTSPLDRVLKDHGLKDLAALHERLDELNESVETLQDQLPPTQERPMEQEREIVDNPNPDTPIQNAENQNDSDQGTRISREVNGVPETKHVFSRKSKRRRNVRVVSHDGTRGFLQTAKGYR